MARLYGGGVRRQELARWWDELYDRDPYSVEGHLQVLHHYSSRRHGSHGLMYGFARDTAGVAPPGSPLPVLVQYARVEEYRALREENARQTGVGIGQHGSHDGAAGDVRRTWQRWITGRPDCPPPPGEVRDLNYLTHAACSAGLTDIAGSLFTIAGQRATLTPWSYTGDPSRQITKWRKEFLPRG